MHLSKKSMKRYCSTKKPLQNMPHSNIVNITNKLSSIVRIVVMKSKQAKQAKHISTCTNRKECDLFANLCLASNETISTFNCMENL